MPVVKEHYANLSPCNPPAADYRMYNTHAGLP